jgi:hypothetical protein
MITDGERMREDDDGGMDAAAADGRTWGDRLGDAAAQAGDLLKTRLEIFREEAAEKAEHAARGAAGMAIAIGLAVGATLLFAAFLAALLAKLFGSVVLGILGAFVIYAGLAALFGWQAARSLARVKPGDFPATRAELLRDVEAIQDALSLGPDGEPGDAEPPDSRGEAEVEDLEARFRAGAE